VLRHRYRRGKQLSMCGLLAYRHSDGGGEQVAAWMGFDGSSPLTVGGA
jgi:hypothetical protein